MINFTIRGNDIHFGDLKIGDPFCAYGDNGLPYYYIKCDCGSSSNHHNSIRFDETGYVKHFEDYDSVIPIDIEIEIMGYQGVYDASTFNK